MNKGLYKITILNSRQLRTARNQLTKKNRYLLFKKIQNAYP